MIKFTPQPHPMVVKPEKVMESINEEMMDHIGDILVDVEYSLDGPSMNIEADGDEFFTEEYIKRSAEATIYQYYEQLMDKAVRKNPVI